jgi:hypothetical protein
MTAKKMQCIYCKQKTLSYDTSEDAVCIECYTKQRKNMNKDKVTVKNKIIIEKQNLDEKIEKLSSFVLSTKFASLSSEQKYALNNQLRAMNDYSRALRDRIIDLTRQESE